MRFGICMPSDRSTALRAAGWDYLEEVVPQLLQGDLPDTEWQGVDRVNASSLPIPAANQLVPGTIKVTGPDLDWDRLVAYMECIVQRAAKIGVKTLVFGSGAARTVPDGFDRILAKDQILRFARMAADQCGRNEIMLVVEALHRGECNIINSIGEAMEYARAINHPHFQCLADSYHFWMEDEPLENLMGAMPWIRHVHVADKAGRVAPGESGTSDYRPFFAVLKRGGYEGSITVETIDPSRIDSIPDGAKRVLDFLKRQWNDV